MRGAVRIFGWVWLAAVAAAGLVLMAWGHLGTGRGLLYVLFGAALPGFMALRRTRPKTIAPPRVQRPRAPLEIDPSHVGRPPEV